MAGTIALSDIVRFERVTVGGREGGREGALVCNGAKNYAEMVAMVALNGPDCSNVDILSSRMPVFQRA